MAGYACRRGGGMFLYLASTPTLVTLYIEGYGGGGGGGGGGDDMMKGITQCAPLSVPDAAILYGM